MTLLFTGIACLLFTAYGGLIVAYQRVWNAIPWFVPVAGTDTTPQDAPGRTRITVLVPARNEEATITGCLLSLARQSYPKDRFEVIVLDDHSTDGTAAAVGAFGLRPEADGLALRCLPLSDVSQPAGFNAYKKFAIAIGVGAASGELIVTTDADCSFPRHWLLTLAAFYEERGARFIAAPVRIEAAGDRHRSLLGIFQTLDFITLQGITGAAVHSRFHTMCNGANLAYTRKAFLEAGGFGGIDHIPSGDDMFLMHKIAALYPGKVFFLKSPDAIVTTRPEVSWKGFFHQRVRWASKADSYHDKRIFWILLLVYIVNLGYIVLLAGAFFHSRWLWLFLFLLGMKTVVEYPFVRKVAGFFGQQDLMVYFPILQPLHILYTVIVGWLGKFGSYHWKGRTIHK